MSTYWATDEGWPYPDALQDWEDLDGQADEDLLNIRLAPHLYDDLDPLERTVLGARFGIGGANVRSMKQLLRETGRPREELRQALGSGLAKVRAHLV